MSIEVHDTAFVIAYYRSKYEESKDAFASLWVKPGLEIWANDFAQKVSPYDDILHSMRNRYFHEALQNIASEKEKLLFINIGAGFSMYPYALPYSVETIEIDLPPIAEYKSKRVDEFRGQGSIPQRKVVHFGGDITSETKQQQFYNLLEAYQGYKKVILIEGVLFFLKKEQIDIVFSFCRKIQKEGDILFSESYNETIEETQVFKNLVTYFSEELNSENSIHSFLPHSFYDDLDGYKLLERNSSFEMGKALSLIPKELQEEEVLNEFFYKLERVQQ